MDGQPMHRHIKRERDMSYRCPRCHAPARQIATCPRCLQEVCMDCRHGTGKGHDHQEVCGVCSQELCARDKLAGCEPCHCHQDNPLYKYQCPQHGAKRRKRKA